MSNSPKFTDSTYSSNIAYFTFIDDFKHGVDKVKSRLIKWERETADGYESRKNNAVLFNVVKKTIETARGMMFRRELTWSDDLNKDFISCAENIDNNDTELNDFIKEAATNSLWDGISFILVDTPSTDQEVVTLQQQKALGIIPYFTHIRASQILNRRIEKGRLVQITIDENVTEPVGLFGERSINQQRVLFIGGGRIYRNDIIVSEWTNSLNYIPIVPVYSNKIGYLDGSPKYLELAYLNLKHFNLSSQLDKALYTASNPIPILYGSQSNGEQSITIGVDTALRFNSKQEGGFEWGEFKGTSIDKLQDEIKNTERRMNELAINTLTENNKEKTATEAAIVSVKETSDLTSIASSIEWSANVAYQIWCEMQKLNPTGEIFLNKDFASVGLKPDEARVYLDMYNSGTLTLDQLWTELQNREFIKEFDRDIALSELEAQNQSVKI